MNTCTGVFKGRILKRSEVLWSKRRFPVCTMCALSFCTYIPTTARCLYVSVRILVTTYIQWSSSTEYGIRST